jgi:hypothetical protein
MDATRCHFAEDLGLARVPDDQRHDFLVRSRAWANHDAPQDAPDYREERVLHEAVMDSLELDRVQAADRIAHEGRLEGALRARTEARRKGLDEAIALLERERPAGLEALRRSGGGLLRLAFLWQEAAAAPAPSGPGLAELLGPGAADADLAALRACDGPATGPGARAALLDLCGRQAAGLTDAGQRLLAAEELEDRRAALVEAATPDAASARRHRRIGQLSRRRRQAFQDLERIRKAREREGRRQGKEARRVGDGLTAGLAGMMQDIVETASQADPELGHHVDQARARAEAPAAAEGVAAEGALMEQLGGMLKDLVADVSRADPELGGRFERARPEAPAATGSGTGAERSAILDGLAGWAGNAGDLVSLALSDPEALGRALGRPGTKADDAPGNEAPASVRSAAVGSIGGSPKTRENDEPPAERVDTMPELTAYLRRAKEFEERERALGTPPVEDIDPNEYRPSPLKIWEEEQRREREKTRSLRSDEAGPSRESRKTRENDEAPRAWPPFDEGSDDGHRPVRGPRMSTRGPHSLHSCPNDRSMPVKSDGIRRRFACRDDRVARRYRSRGSCRHCSRFRLEFRTQ